MTRHFFIFLGTFVLGALIALGARTASHEPASTHSAQVSADPHATHRAAPAQPAQVVAAPAESTVPVNTICAICGMPVDPKLPIATYQGKTIGFGCKMCPAKFQAEPDKYGPLFLRNEVVKN